MVGAYAGQEAVGDRLSLLWEIVVAQMPAGGQLMCAPLNKPGPGHAESVGPGLVTEDLSEVHFIMDQVVASSSWLPGQCG